MVIILDGLAILAIIATVTVSANLAILATLATGRTLGYWKSKMWRGSNLSAFLGLRVK